MSAVLAARRRRSEKRKREDEDVIKTEPDKKRATGAADENDFEQDDDEASLKVPQYYGLTSIHDILYRKHVLRKIHSRKEETNFPFLSLPAEIRNMIYRYLLVSQAQSFYRRGHPSIKIPIDLERPAFLKKLWQPGGIETSILAVNHQIHFESSKILYTENKCKVDACGHSSFIDYRVDTTNTVSMATRSLRSGRKVDMVKYTGLIYPHMVSRLRNIEFSIKLPNNMEGAYYYSYYSAPVEYTIHEQLEKLAKLLITRAGQEGWEDELSVHGKKWVIKFQCGDKVGLSALRIMLYPLMNAKIMKILREGQVAIHIEGKVPEGWKDVMEMLLDNGATVGEVKEVPADPRDLTHAYKLLSYFMTMKGKYLPRSLIKVEEKRRGVRHCGNCGGHHLWDSDDDEYYDEDMDGYPYDYFEGW